MAESIKKKEPFRITNDDQLAWAADKADTNRRLANQYMDKAKESYDFYLGEANKALDDVQYFNDMIAQYADEQHRNNPEWKYEDSPFLRIVWTKPDTKLKVSNTKDVIKQFGDKYVKTETKIKWQELKDYIGKDYHVSDDGTVVTKDGEIISGVKGYKVPEAMQIKYKNGKGHWFVGDKR